MAYMAMLVADVLDRILWRARPYERSPGAVEAVVAPAAAEMERLLESGGLRTDFRPFHGLVARTAAAAREAVDPAAPPRPRVGVIGEIFVRSHPGSNEELLRELERHGAEVVNASLAEWITYATWSRVLEHRRGCARALRGWRPGAARRSLRRWLGQAAEYRYLDWRRRRLYAAAARHLDIAPDHAVHEVARRPDGERHFSFAVGTEAVLGIGGALEHAAHGCDGVVNVYPFTCMPGTMATAVLGPLLGGMGLPYLEVPCDGTRQPNRETAVRTFVWQAAQRRELRAARGTA
jgi:predicted nucleotide-binding protein (sugar kinase/HSP70/actin superfamily)